MLGKVWKTWQIKSKFLQIRGIGDKPALNRVS